MKIDIKSVWQKNKFGILVLVLYFVLTFFFMISRVPTFDESHAWVVAKYMNLQNAYFILKTEGHPILWYCLLYPFAKYTNWYPYPMILLNYVFSLFSVFLVWFKSPFTFIMKLAIIFSAMFLLKLSIFARGYSLGILLLFLLCIMHKNILKRPFIYAFILILGMNTNIVTSIGISWFILDFIYNVIKSEFTGFKKSGLCLLVIFGVILFVSPFITSFGTDLSRGLSEIGPKFLVAFFKYPFYYLLCLYLALICVFLYKIKNLWLISFLIYTNTVMVILFSFFYPGFYHHFMFFFVYLIVFMWLSDAEKIIGSGRDINIVNVLSALILVPPINTNLELENVLNFKYIDNPKSIVNMLNKESKFRNSIVYIDAAEHNLIPYIKDDIKLMNSCTLEPISWNVLTITECAEDFDKKISKNIKPVFLLSKTNYDSIKDRKIGQNGKINIYEFKEEN